MSKRNPATAALLRWYDNLSSDPHAAELETIKMIVESQTRMALSMTELADATKEAIKAMNERYELLDQHTSEAIKLLAGRIEMIERSLAAQANLMH